MLAETGLNDGWRANTEHAIQQVLLTSEFSYQLRLWSGEHASLRSQCGFSQLQSTERALVQKVAVEPSVLLKEE